MDSSKYCPSFQDIFSPSSTFKKNFLQAASLFNFLLQFSPSSTDEASSSYASDASSSSSSSSAATTAFSSLIVFSIYHASFSSTANTASISHRQIAHLFVVNPYNPDILSDHENHVNEKVKS